MQTGLYFLVKEDFHYLYSNNPCETNYNLLVLYVNIHNKKTILVKRESEPQITVKRDENGNFPPYESITDYLYDLKPKSIIEI